MGKKLARNITLHAENEDGSHQTFRFKAGEEVPEPLVDRITNPDVWADDGDADLIGESPKTDPLMERNKADLVAIADLCDADGSDANTKAELVAAIRETGYDGNGADLLDGE